MILHYYFARRFLKVFLGMLMIFFLFVSLLDLVDQLRRFDASVTFGQVLTLTLLNTPQALYQMLPLVMILASIALFLSLARSSELVVSRASGRSGLASLIAPAMVAAVIGAVSVGMGNPIVAATSKRFSDLAERYDNGGNNVLSIGADGLWLRQGDDTGQTVIRAARTNPEATALYDVSFVAYAPNGGPVRRIEAAEARLEPGAWILHDAKSWPLHPGVNPETAAYRLETLLVPSTLTQDNIRDRFGNPSAVSIWDLSGFIGDLERAGFSARRHQVWLQMELARPLFLVALVLVGAGFTMRHSRLGRTGISVLAAIMLGFGLYYIRNFAQIMGENGQISPYLAAWAPPVAALLLALGLILHMEDG
ncbi:LPS export ABC transporter permease LptG [Puniceibacterium confluentis]|uniref:LPS export ABC transporter permease LptG n=1 Tax=Puniceibacterium confluentis TaxID=1958944 RepID=UPI003565E07C